MRKWPICTRAPSYKNLRKIFFGDSNVVITFIVFLFGIIYRLMFFYLTGFQNQRLEHRIRLDKFNFFRFFKHLGYQGASRHENITYEITLNSVSETRRITDVEDFFAALKKVHSR